MLRRVKTAKQKVKSKSRRGKSTKSKGERARGTIARSVPDVSESVPVRKTSNGRPIKPVPCKKAQKDGMTSLEVVSGWPKKEKGKKR